MANTRGKNTNLVLLDLTAFGVCSAAGRDRRRWKHFLGNVLITCKLKFYAVSASKRLLEVTHAFARSTQELQHSTHDSIRRA